ncbi:hypothetical protein LX36DRAFT_245678 [Colletotrichum falcatum]|nr:hypothetical protein LX36DRAFT_245678 [Colletotrichum falcatum]
MAGGGVIEGEVWRLAAHAPSRQQQQMDGRQCREASEARQVKARQGKAKQRKADQSPVGRRRLRHTHTHTHTAGRLDPWTLSASGVQVGKLRHFRRRSFSSASGPCEGGGGDPFFFLVCCCFCCRVRVTSQMTKPRSYRPSYLHLAPPRCLFPKARVAHLAEALDLDVTSSGTQEAGATTAGKERLGEPFPFLLARQFAQREAACHSPVAMEAW